MVAAVVALVLAAAFVASDRKQDTESADTAAGTSNTLGPELPPIPEETLYSIPGVTFGPAPFDTAPLVRAVETDAEFQDTARSVSARVVLRKGITVAVVVVYQLSQRVVSEPGYVEDLLRGVSEEAVRSQRTTIRGSPALYYVIQDLDSLVAVKAGVAVFVVARRQTQRSELDQIASELIAKVP